MSKKFLHLFQSSFLEYTRFQQNRYPKELIALCEASIYSPEQLEGLSDQGKIYTIFTDFWIGADKMAERSALELYQLTTELLDAISDREYQLLFEHLPDEIEDYPTNLLIVAKRYFTNEAYDLYLSYLVQGAAAGNGQTAPNFEPLAPDVQDELNHRLEQSPWYDKREESLSASHRYYIEVRRLLVQMYNEGYAVEAALRNSLIF